MDTRVNRQLNYSRLLPRSLLFWAGILAILAAAWALAAYFKPHDPLHVLPLAAACPGAILVFYYRMVGSQGIRRHLLGIANAKPLDADGLEPGLSRAVTDFNDLLGTLRGAGQDLEFHEALYCLRSAWALRLRRYREAAAAVKAELQPILLADLADMSQAATAISRSVTAEMDATQNLIELAHRSMK